MEINHLLKDVINLNEYITATQEFSNKYMNLKVTINIATVLTLKKIRSLEIEYLNKCDENGVACLVFERLLATPPSKVWGVLAKELVLLLQYWLEAIRKHFVNYSTRWWMFLKLILKFIKELRLKDPAVPNMLVELTAECLFDLATAARPDVFQRHEILHCLNMVCAESGREIRFAMRTKFGDYFVKLASVLATSGYLPCQYSSLECLLRWLVPRQERSLRSAAADKWFPRDLCPLTARNLFLNSSWMNFFQDARDFLNALNEGNGLVTSVICRRLTIGEIVIINGTERQQSWLDFNTSGKSISVLLDPRVLEVFGVADHRSCETLLIDEEITETALLRRESLGLTITLNTLRSPYIRPTYISTGDKRQLTIVVSSQTNLRTLDGAMRNTFGGKYQLQLDLETDISQSPQRSYNKNKNEFNSEEDTRFSHPIEVKRRKHSGYIVRNKNTGGTISPSTASTSSLIQLKDRLAALPRYKFEREPVSVCAQPALSNVTELTEQDDRSTYTATTVKFQPYGVCHKSFKKPSDQKTVAEKISRSEGETVKKKSRGGRRLLSPVVSDDNATSLLLAATIGSTSDSVINETVERLSKSKDYDDDNIINLLVQEALQANPKSREVSDSGINTDEKKSQEESEAIDDTPKEIKESKSRVPIKKNCTIVSKSTTDDESNTEAINETPAFGTERQQSWLDFNTSGKSISVLLDPRVLEVFGVADHRSCETLLIDEEITETALLRRESLGLTITLNTLRSPYIRPTYISTGDKRQLTIVVSSQTNLRTLDGAMRNTFGGKYQLQLDLETDISQSPQRSYNKNKNEFNSEEDTRFSHPIEVKRRKHSGYIVRNKNTGGTISPSTASTSSLIQLKDRLAALPRYKFEREPVSVCAQPALSNVTELTEQDDRSTYTATTVKFQPYGVCHKSFKKPSDQKTVAEKISRSEGETVKKKSRGGRRLLSPVVSDDNATSLLLAATIGSTSDSVINETVERLSKSKDYDDDNIINLLVQEALQANPKSREVSDSGINTDEKKSQEESEAIDDTPKEIKESKSRVPIKKNCTIVSKSTTDDESNTEAINETPAFVNIRKNTWKSKPKTTVEAEKPTFHVKAVEEFFSQHIASNERGEIVISPTLARKINETSSETSEHCDDNYLLMDEDVNTDLEQAIFNDIAIFDCLNDMVDKVCSDLDKCTAYLCKENVIAGANEIVQVEDSEIVKDKSYRTPKSKPLEIQRPKRNIKLKYKPAKKTKPRVTNKIKNVEQECTKKMSTIIEQKEEDTILEEINPGNDSEHVDLVRISSPVKKSLTPFIENTRTPLARRKRKLYSPKDDDVDKEIQRCTIEKTSDDIPLSEIKASKNTKTTATCYKELENERKKYTRLPRSRKSKAKAKEMPSPRTLKMNSIFDNLKQTVESDEKITLVDKNADVYNFTSDSEDDDFKTKIEIKKPLSATTVKKSRSIHRAMESESSYEEVIKNNTVKRKKVTKRANKRNPEKKVPVVELVGKQDLVDERMREAVREELNTSLIIEYPKNLEPTEIEPRLKEVPQMEEIYDSVSNDTSTSKMNTKKTPNEQLHDSASNDTLAPKKRAYKRTIKTKVRHDDKSNDTTASKRKVTERKNKNARNLLIKKEKGSVKKDIATTVSVIADDGTISPLPGLVVESMPKHKEDDSLTANMIQKFKKIYKDGPDIINDSVNTQNMLSDVERFNNSAQNCINIADDLYFVDNNKENVEVKTERDIHKKGKKVIQTKTTKGTQKKIKTEQVDEIIEIIDIPLVNDNQSKKSFASDGINAHGDLDEAPPNPDTIKEVLQPRELQDMDRSMREYFTKLTREVHNSSYKDRNSSKSTEGEEVRTIMRKEIEKGVISPVISIKRLSFEDINRWMPSRRTSDTDSPQTSYKLRSQNKQIDEHSTNAKSETELNLNSTETTPKSAGQTRKPKETSTPESIKSKSAILRITRMSLEEFDKWLPMPKTFEAEKASQQKDKSCIKKLIYRTRSQTRNKNTTEASMQIQKEFENIKKTAKDSAKSRRVEIDTDSDLIDSNVTHTGKLRKESSLQKDDYNLQVSDRDSDEAKSISAFKISNTLKKATFDKRESTKGDTDLHEPKSKTSHVKIAIKLGTKTERDSDEASTKSKPVGKAKPIISPIKLHGDLAMNTEHDSSDDECLMKIRSVFSKPKDSKKCSLRNAKSKSVESTKSPISSRKRKSTSPILSEPKRRYVDAPVGECKFAESKRKIEISDDVIVTESGPSINSVNDWFKRTGTTGHRDNNSSVFYKDTLHNVMEKLETTLVEINQNTSKKFVNLFVDAQKNLCDQRDEHHKLYKEVATELFSAMFRIVEEKFADLHRKSQEISNGFMDKLKKQAFDLISEDCKRKRAMVVLLKEDVQAVMDHIDRSRSTDSP